MKKKMKDKEQRLQYQVEWMRKKRARIKAERVLRTAFLETIGKELDKMENVEREKMKVRLLRALRGEGRVLRASR